MDEEYIKAIWRQGPSEYGSPRRQTDSSPRIPDNRRKTALNRLTDRYRRFLRAEIIFAFAIPVMVSGIISRNGHSPIVIIAFILFFLTAAAVDYHIFRRLKEISVDTMTTSDVIRKAMDCRRLHLISIIFLLPFALLCVGILAWALAFDTYFITGMAAGGIVGISIGIVQFRRFMSDYRRINS